MAVVVPITVTTTTARGRASENFSGGDYRHCDRLPASVLDLSLGHLLIYYLSIVSLILLIVLFLLPKILFVYRTRVRGG